MGIDEYKCLRFGAKNKENLYLFVSDKEVNEGLDPRETI